MTVQRVFEFDVFKPAYGGASVKVYDGGTQNLATLYVDIAKSSTLANPQILTNVTLNGVAGGKFAQPVYIDGSYELEIDGSETTGIERDTIVTLTGEDASGAEVQATGGTRLETLANLFGIIVYAHHHGAIGPGESAATNDATITAAAGVVSGRNGGCVIVPTGTIPFNDLSLGAGVKICGHGVDSTILQSTTGAKVIEITGDDAGLMNLTLDGVSKVASSIGIEAIDKRIFLENVVVKRFATGIHCKGMEQGKWHDLTISDCTDGLKGHGDTDAGGGAGGAAFQFLNWTGGLVELCSGIGVDLSYEDALCHHNTLEHVGFERQTGTALRVNGARFGAFPGCWWKNNIIDLDVLDDTDTTVDDNKVVGLHFPDVYIDGTAINIKDTAQDVVFERAEITGACTITLTTPTNAILCLDCNIGANVTLAGSAEKWTQRRRINHGGVAGLTTDGSDVTAWSFTLERGQLGIFEAKVTGNQRDGINRALYHFGAMVVRPGSTLDYDAQTGNFTVGLIITGAGSGATARITADADAGAAGTLTLRDIVGTFDDGEVITDTSTGSADVNGTITDNNAVMLRFYNLTGAAGAAVDEFQFFGLSVGFADLAAAGSIAIIDAQPGEQWKIREMFTVPSTDFSGGGGDRLLTVSDSARSYSLIPAASLQTIVNQRWGDAGLPWPGTPADQNVATVAGSDVSAAYSGGSADYSAGTIDIQIWAQKVTEKTDPFGAGVEDVAGWNARFVVNGNDIEVDVTGAAATTVEWFVEVTGVLD